MTNFTSEAYCDKQTAYQGLFQHDRGDSTITINDTLITTEDVAYARARAELLAGGYAEKWVTISCVHIAGLKQNDIISFKGQNWLVKEISLLFSPPKLTMTIKGLRYEQCINEFNF